MTSPPTLPANTMLSMGKTAGLKRQYRPRIVARLPPDRGQRFEVAVLRYGLLAEQQS